MQCRVTGRDRDAAGEGTSARAGRPPLVSDRVADGGVDPERRLWGHGWIVSTTAGGPRRFGAGPGRGITDVAGRGRTDDAAGPGQRHGGRATAVAQGKRSSQRVARTAPQRYRRSQPDAVQTARKKSAPLREAKLERAPRNVGKSKAPAQKAVEKRAKATVPQKPAPAKTKRPAAKRRG